MRFKITREALLKPLQQISGVVDRRQTMPALSNVLIRHEAKGLSFCATDLEIELVVHSESRVSDTDACALPARKLLEICRALPEASSIDVHIKDGKGVITTARSRFTLIAHPVEGFPVLEKMEQHESLRLSAKRFRQLLAGTAFAMAQQDVRFYLNGILLEIKPGKLTAVATDGHRLALNEVECESTATTQVIVPRKAAIELLRLLPADESHVDLSLGSNHLRVQTEGLRFTTKLIDGRYPEYQRVLPKDLDKRITLAIEEFRQALARTSILSNEKFKGVRMSLQNGLLKLQAQNLEHEMADEELEVNYAGESIDTGFNVNYLIEYLSAMGGETVQIDLKDARSSILMKSDAVDASLYVVMPMQL